MQQRVGEALARHAPAAHGRQHRAVGVLLVGGVARHVEQVRAGAQRVDGRRAPELTVTRLASGLPVGADLEYADEVTLGRALAGRRSL